MKIDINPVQAMKLSSIIYYIADEDLDDLWEALRDLRPAGPEVYKISPNPQYEPQYGSHYEMYVLKPLDWYPSLPLDYNSGKYHRNDRTGTPPCTSEGS